MWKFSMMHTVYQSEHVLLFILKSVGFMFHSLLSLISQTSQYSHRVDASILNSSQTDLNFVIGVTKLSQKCHSCIMTQAQKLSSDRKQGKYSCLKATMMINFTDRKCGHKLKLGGRLQTWVKKEPRWV